MNSLIFQKQSTLYLKNYLKLRLFYISYNKYLIYYPIKTMYVYAKSMFINQIIEMQISVFFI